jgi:hypothetical protein
MHPFAQRYARRLPIGDSHLLQLLNHKTSGGAIDEDWYEFVENDKDGAFVAKYLVYNAYNHDRPAKSEHSFRKYDETDTLIEHGTIQSK